MFATQDLPTNYYTILHLPTTATDEEIRRNYKELARILHPDKNPDDPKATAEFQILQEAYSTLSDPLRRAQYDTHFQYTYYQSKHAQRAQQTRRDSNVFDPEYEFAKHQAPHRFRPHTPPKKPASSPAEIFLRERREKEHRRQLRKDEKHWEKFAKEFAESEKEKVGRRVENEGPIPEWLENVVEVDGYVGGKEPVVMDGETLIDIEEDLIKLDKVRVEEMPRPVFPCEADGSSDGATAGSFAFGEVKPVPNEFFESDNTAGTFEGLNPQVSMSDSDQWRESEFGRPGERLRRRGSLGSRGRKATEEARRANGEVRKDNEEVGDEAPPSLCAPAKSEWDIFFDRFETDLKV
ncbi:hypothetical protein FKW77_001790 [Venturia effusa]|uniref:J domain-containing protein n=1 Tax=Venturia effusa TaxID=50376 RepID=A0A517L8Q0_9PEZI|nr:hypothetical protein FKW77_001790 [Venturia effusa]